MENLSRSAFAKFARSRDPVQTVDCKTPNQQPENYVDKVHGLHQSSEVTASRLIHPFQRLTNPQVGLCMRNGTWVLNHFLGHEDEFCAPVISGIDISPFPGCMICFSV